MAAVTQGQWGVWLAARVLCWGLAPADPLRPHTSPARPTGMLPVCTGGAVAPEVTWGTWPCGQRDGNVRVPRYCRA